MRTKEDQERARVAELSIRYISDFADTAEELAAHLEAAREAGYAAGLKDERDRILGNIRRALERGFGIVHE